MYRNKILALATVTVLSLGVGTAMAQEGPTVFSPNDWAAPPLANTTQTTSGMHATNGYGATNGYQENTAPRAGSSDAPQSPYMTNGVDGVSMGGG